MEGSSDAEPMLCEIVWMMDYDFKAAMVMHDHDVEVSCTSRNTMTCNRPDPGFFRMRPPDGAERPAASEDVELPEGEWECELCGARNQGKFCSECGGPRPR